MIESSVASSETLGALLEGVEPDDEDDDADADDPLGDPGLLNDASSSSEIGQKRRALDRVTRSQRLGRLRVMLDARIHRRRPLARRAGGGCALLVCCGGT